MHQKVFIIALFEYIGFSIIGSSALLVYYLINLNNHAINV